MNRLHPMTLVMARALEVDLRRLTPEDEIPPEVLTNMAEFFSAWTPDDGNEDHPDLAAFMEQYHRMAGCEEEGFREDLVRAFNDGLLRHPRGEYIIGQSPQS